MACCLSINSGCSDKYEYDTDYSYYKDVNISIANTDENNMLELHITPSINTYAVKIQTNPEDILIDAAAYTYKIDDTSIAEINQEGLITMKKAGETKLSVSFRGNHEIYTDCKIKVIKDPIYVKELKVPESTFVEINKTLNLSELITVLPASADNKTLLYTVEDETFASVDDKGIVTGLSVGYTNITVATTDGSNLSKTIALEIKDKIKVTDISLGKIANIEGKELPVGQKFNLGKEITITPENASDKTVKYEITSGQTVASIDENGILEALAAGDATVTITSGDGNVTKTVNIKVKDGIEFYERGLWSVSTCAKYSTGLDYVQDNATGKPEHILDGKEGTYLSLAKPHKLGSGDQKYEKVYFTIDTGVENMPFSGIKYQHRKFGYDWLNARKIEMAGSNDGVNFDVIKTDVETPFKINQTCICDIDLESTFNYRYIRITITEWYIPSGANLQVAEVSIKK